MRYRLSFEVIVHSFLNEKAGQFLIVEALKEKNIKFLQNRGATFANGQGYNKNGKWVNFNTYKHGCSAIHTISLIESSL